ncbi:MAG: GNAT family N-acetyltransferase, partial [Streptococcus sanguinis]|nr:GNAT family N-acetyltransferase [Streptococcus sanguinis]
EFYSKYGFEKFSQHDYITGETVDTDWLLRKKLK